jgi:hypothetical protein
MIKTARKSHSSKKDSNKKQSKLNFNWSFTKKYPKTPNKQKNFESAKNLLTIVIEN